MIKAHIALHKSPDGKLTVLAASEDADVARKAYKDCNDAGETALAYRVRLDKSKKHAATAANPSKTAKPTKPKS